VADRPEIERELRLALQLLSRKLAAYMSKRGQADMAKKRANLYAKYIPLIAEFCTELAGKKKEPNYKKILEENIIESKQTDEVENTIDSNPTVDEEN
jgi:DNA topoisomerase VI subunit B